MNHHETTAKRMNIEIPQQMRKMNALEIVAYMQVHFETDMGNNPKNKATAALQDCFHTFQDPEHWKMPFYARFPQDNVGREASELLKAAIIWYHGIEPYQTFSGIGTHGYAC